MSILIYIDQVEKKIKSTAHELVSYGIALSKLMNIDAHVLLLEETTDSLNWIDNKGIKKIIQSKDLFTSFDAYRYAKSIAYVAEKTQATVVLFSHTPNGKALSAMVSAFLKAGLASAVVDLPSSVSPFIIKKTTFGGKAFGHLTIHSSKKVISLNPNSFSVQEINENQTAEKILMDIIPSVSKTNLLKREMIKGEVPLTEATLVVSGGRGLKAPENWGIIIDLAKAIGATTACSRPVADSGWRPHHEHVGQTGIQIAPNLYIAIGISGAIQHLAGVNRSKVIVVINNDPEAPFFKVADYGIVGDAFQVVPKITQALLSFKKALL